jgi:hypothetical protein
LYHGLHPTKSLCAPAMDLSMHLMAMLYVDLRLFPLPLLIVMLMEKVRLCSLLGLRLISALDLRDGGYKTQDETMRRGS